MTISIQFLDFHMNLCVLARCLCCLFLNVTSIVCVYVCGVMEATGFGFGFGNLEF